MLYQSQFGHIAPFAISPVHHMKIYSLFFTRPTTPNVDHTLLTTLVLDAAEQQDAHRSAMKAIVLGRVDLHSA